ncbi:MAG: response regulator transcription factor [Clostridiales bacterium]|jgi:LuxR family maltose regulon positive regulatory protein|nr:response regulator transcription factor [Clostridiales bacterium]
MDFLLSSGTTKRFTEIRKHFLSGFTKLRSNLTAEELPVDLTTREREIALLAASGLCNSEIAEKLTISDSTVRAHMRTIFQKLDIDRRARLAEKLK